MNCRPCPLKPFAIVLTALVASVAAAPLRAAPASRTDMVEHAFGATAIQAVSGHGRLSIGVAKDGDLTTLVWPNPSYSDQLGFVSSNAVNARELPRFGAPPASGLFLGLLVQVSGQAAKVVWLHDSTLFSIAQDYGPKDGANIYSKFTSEILGLQVTVIDAVVPGSSGDASGDALVRQVQVTKTKATAAAALELRTYANLSPQPTNSRLPELPLVDWGLDGRNDFAAVWDEGAKAVVHFHPDNQLIYSKITDVLAPVVDYGPIGAALAAGQVSAAEAGKFAGSLDSSYGAGAYVALTTLPAPMGHHIGYDRADFCGAIGTLIDNVLNLPTIFPGYVLPMDPTALNVLRCSPVRTFVDLDMAWKHPAVDAFTAATLTTLPAGNIAAGEVDEVLATPLVFNGDVATAAVVVGFGPSAKVAKAALAAVTDATVAVQASEAALVTFLQTARVPKNADALVTQVARRALINLRVGTDAATGATVASISRQPPYGLDWPRDGAFFSVIFDASGQAELAEKRADLTAKWQRKVAVKPTPLIDPPPPTDPRTGKTDEYPANAWEMNYYADGLPGGNFRFEIDNTAFAVWSLCAHAHFTAKPAEALQKRWAAIESAADLLVAWRDPKTGLHAPAQEDDNAAATQTLHGAVTVMGALEQAARAAELLGKADATKRWRERATEVQTAIIKHLFDEKTGLFKQADNATANPGSAGSGPTAWLVWPMRVLPWTDKRVQAQLAADFASIQGVLDLQGDDGGAYYLKNLLSTALVLGADPDWRAKIQAALVKSAKQATAGTHHFGEVTLPKVGLAGRFADQRVATPHLWEGGLFYLTALALEDPAALLRDRPQPAAPKPAAKIEDSGCTSGATNGNSRVVWLLLGLAGLAVAMTHRRR